MQPSVKACPKCGTRYDVAASFCQHDGMGLAVIAQADDPYIGRVLRGQFRVEEIIGTGGMGVVYRARHQALDRDVALKVLHPSLLSNDDVVRRFRREAQVCTALDHPNVVRVFLLDQLEDGSFYIAMEHLVGQSLIDVLRASGPLALSRALHVALQVCDGVGEAHRQGVVHRDIKPENIFLVRRGDDPDFVKVLDFGIARFVWADQTTKTQAGLVFGTAGYISPEGASGEPTDARSDVYSIGVLLYQLLSGQKPFDAPSPVALLMKHVQEAPPPILARVPHLPRPVADVVMRALEKDPAKRFGDARELAAALRIAASASGIIVGHGFMTASASSAISISTLPAPPRHSRLVPILGVFAAFALGAAAVVAGAMASGLTDHLTATAGEADDTAITDLLTRARAALARGHYDAPAGENVAELTTTVLAEDSANATAIALRREAVAVLRSEARAYGAAGDAEGARRALHKALRFGLEQEEIERALAAIERPAPAQPSLRLAPERPAAGEPVTFVAAATDPAAELVFRVSRAGRSGRATLRAAPGPDPTTRVAAYTFASAGAYRVAVIVGGEEVLTEDIEVVTPVARASGSGTRREPRSSPPREVPTGVQDQGGPAPIPDRGDEAPAPTNDGIDWSVPGSNAPATHRPPRDQGSSSSSPPAEEPPWDTGTEWL